MPLGVTVSAGGSLKPFEGMMLSQLVDELEWPAELDRLVARMQVDGDIRLRAGLGGEAQAVEPDE